MNSTLPDVTTTGPCQVKSSMFCTVDGAIPRLNPTDMLDLDTAFTRYTHMCLACYERQADLFIAGRHS